MIERKCILCNQLHYGAESQTRTDTYFYPKYELPRPEAFTVKRAKLQWPLCDFCIAAEAAYKVFLDDSLSFIATSQAIWLRRSDSNRRPQGYEPCELPTALPRHYVGEGEHPHLGFYELPDKEMKVGGGCRVVQHTVTKQLGKVSRS